jgi:hypothetical protein
MLITVFYGRNRTYTSATKSILGLDLARRCCRERPNGKLLGLKQRQRKSSTAKLRKKAFKWLVAFFYAESISSVLPELNAWLREDPAHRAAFACARRTWRLAGPYLRATEYGADRSEFRAFMDALEEEEFAISRANRSVTDP